MEGEAQVPCKFHQYGHCKFGETCRHFHTQHICSTPQCDRTSCTARHPRPCVYFARFGHCKFGNSCSYIHSIHSKENVNIVNDVIKLKEDLEQILTTLKTKEIEIFKLEEKVRDLEKNLLKSNSKNFKCDLCDYS